MTCPGVIQGVEQWSRWSNLNHRTLLMAKGRSWLPGGGIRLLPFLRYGFILLALGLLLSDTFRLAFSANSSQDVSPRTEPARNAQTVHGNSHARLMSAKRHSGV